MRLTNTLFFLSIPMFAPLNFQPSDGEYLSVKNSGIVIIVLILLSHVLNVSWEPRSVMVRTLPLLIPVLDSFHCDITSTLYEACGKRRTRLLYPPILDLVEEPLGCAAVIDETFCRHVEGPCILPPRPHYRRDLLVSEFWENSYRPSHVCNIARLKKFFQKNNNFRGQTL